MRSLLIPGLLLGVLLILLLILAVLYKERHDREEADFRAYLETPAVRERLNRAFRREGPVPSPEERDKAKVAYDEALAALDEAKAAYRKAEATYDNLDRADVARGKALAACSEALAAYNEAWAAFDEARAALDRAEEGPMPSLEELREEWRDQRRVLSGR